MIPISRSKQRKETFRKEYTEQLNQLNVLKAKVSDHKPLEEDEKESLQEIAAKIDRHNTQAKGKPKPDAGPASQEIVVRDTHLKKQRKQIGEIIKDLKTAGIAPEAHAKKEDKKPKKAKIQLGATTINGSVPREMTVAIIDEIRDAVIEILSDDPAVREELLVRINDIVKRLPL